ncbi:PHP domain-containing protein [Marinobacter sp. X15-166B]|uniref:PHP domain-containing protein n=1 Tax=Marinobacter sp. X15-166B TaxID=1897620 RepID=UPI00085BB89A|nr:PHP domain-containing protein [Marinobacter sp. X15-166B]OEY67143.1 phosphatase [Marinobacter sp. X15-166B]
MTIPQALPLCIDLHCHSTASDGALSPRALLERASEMGVTHLAVTDHDTLAGLAEARDAAHQLGVALINGVELSCVWRSHTIHIVGLDFDHQDVRFLAALDGQHENRWRRARTIAGKLSRRNPDALLALATAHAGDDVPGRPHFARALVEQGVVKDINQAFKRHLGAGKPGDVKAFWPELDEVVRWLVEAGGIAVLAHPKKYRLTATKLRQLVADFRRAGGQALEVSTSGQTATDMAFLAELCKKENLWASQGSDFHFPGAAWSELGRISKLPDGLAPVWHYFRQPIAATGDQSGA